MIMLGYVGFTVSRHLHAVADSDQRATLLSVKGLIFNMAYGIYSLAFSFTLRGMEPYGTAALQQVLGWQAAVFTAIMAAFGIVVRHQSRQRMH